MRQQILFRCVDTPEDLHLSIDFSSISFPIVAIARAMANDPHFTDVCVKAESTAVEYNDLKGRIDDGRRTD